MSEFRRVLVKVAVGFVVLVGFVMLVLPFKAVAASVDGLPEAKRTRAAAWPTASMRWSLSLNFRN